MDRIKFESFKILHLLLAYFIIQPIFYLTLDDVGSLIYDVCFLLYFLYHFNKQGITFDYIKRNFPSPKQIIKCLGITILLIIFSMGSILLIYYLLYLNSPIIAEESFKSYLPTNQLLLFLSTVIFAPIIEEFAFRGVILEKTRRKFNAPIAIFLNSIIFGILHNDILGSFVFAIVLSILYLKTENILIPILIHFFNNFLSILPSLLSQSSQEQDIVTETYSTVECLSGISVSIFFLIISGIPLIICLFKCWRDFKTKELNNKLIETNTEL